MNKSRSTNLPYLSVLLLILLFFIGEMALYAWGIRRSDRFRSGFVSGQSNITSITKKWRFYLGGSISSEQFLAEDVNRDGITEIVYISGGKVISKYPDDTTVWASEKKDITKLWYVADIDNNGSFEVIASSSISKVHILDGGDGSVLWELESGIIGTPVLIQLHDFDRDGLTDVYIADCYCCTLPTRKTIAISFARGFEHPDVLFELERPDDCSIKEDSYIDVDGDGLSEIVTVQINSIMAFDSFDGSLKYDTGDIGYLKYGNILWTQDVDSNGYPELISLSNFYNSGSGQLSRRIVVSEYHPGDFNIGVNWEYSEYNVPDAEVKYHHRSVNDINGDGTAEISISVYDPVSGWILQLFNAASGAMITSIPGRELTGLVDLDQDGDFEILTTDDLGALEAFDFSSDFEYHSLFRLLNEQPVSVFNRAYMNESCATDEILALDINGDGNKEIITINNDGERIQYLKAWETTNPPMDVADYFPSHNSFILSLAVYSNATRDYPQIVLAKTDGFMVILDNDLLPTNVSSDPEFPLQGIRIGGYYGASEDLQQTPVIGKGAASSSSFLLVTDANGNTVKLDPSGATMIYPPEVTCTFENERFPVASDLYDDGDEEIVTVTKDAVVVRNQTCDLLWNRNITEADTEKILLDPVPGDANSDGILDIFYSKLDTNGYTRYFNVLDGSDGHPLWPQDFIYGGSTNFPITVADYNNNGSDDLFVVLHNLKIFEGQDGSLIGEYGDRTLYDLALVSDINEDGLLETVLHGGPRSVRLLDHDLSVRWIAPQERYNGAYGVIFNCSSGKKFITPKFSSCLLRRIHVETGEIEEEACFASGRMYSDEEEAISSNAYPGYLSPISGHENLTGTGQPTAVFGSTDGWLYLIDPCNYSIVDSLDLESPVGEPVIGDIDNDNFDEIAALVGDGYLYAFDNEDFPAPGWVYENDGTALATNELEDVDYLETYDTLWANWEPVEMATDYEYSIFTSALLPITSPTWIATGNETSVTAANLPLQLDGKYYFAVRATGSTGTSVEVLSDGVRIIDISPPEITIGAVPTEIFPRSDTANYSIITAVMHDRTSLHRYRWEITDAMGQHVLSTADAYISGTDYSAELTWYGRDNNDNVVSPGIYNITVEVEDIASHVVTATVQVTVSHEDDLDASIDSVMRIPRGCSCSFVY